MLEDWEEASEGVKDVLRDVPFGALAGLVSLAEINSLDSAEAEKIKEQWLEKKVK